MTAIEEDGSDKRLVELELACKADGIAPPDLFSLVIAAIAEEILMRTSAEEDWSPLLTSERSCKFNTDVVRGAGHDLALFYADFHSLCWCSVYESVGRVLKFTITVTHEIGKS